MLVPILLRRGVFHLYFEGGGKCAEAYGFARLEATREMGLVLRPLLARFSVSLRAVFCGHWETCVRGHPLASLLSDLSIFAIEKPLTIC